MLPYLRAYVHPIRMHFDPIVMTTGYEEIVVAYGMATTDLIRIKTKLPNLNDYGLILVQRKDDIFRFLKIDELLICIYPGFKKASDDIGLSCAYDFKLQSISKLRDYEQLSRWVTLKGLERADAENRARVTRSLLEKTRIVDLLGPNAIETIIDLMWSTSSFEPLHAITIIATTKRLQLDFPTLREKLRKIGTDLRYVLDSENRVLIRRKSNVTLMDCAKFLFQNSNYFEVSKRKLSRSLGISKSKLSSHLRGYLVVDDEYINKLTVNLGGD